MRFNRAIPGMLDEINKILSNETLNKFVSFRIRVEIDFYPKALIIICIINCNRCNIIDKWHNNNFCNDFHGILYIFRVKIKLDIKLF